MDAFDQLMSRGPVDAELNSAPSGVVRRGDAVFTANAAPGLAVYGEELVDFGGVEHRRWDPKRSKLAAMVLLGREELRLRRDSRVLYLGAASGTTASHVSDICVEGMVYCVEVSQRSFRDLVRLCEARPNMIPILADASRPEAYAQIVEAADIVYQDIAQRLQVDIFVRNMRFFEASSGVLMLKSRSIDVNKDPRKVFADVRAKLSAEGMRVIEFVELEPYAKDHAAFVLEV